MTAGSETDSNQIEAARAGRIEKDFMVCGRGGDGIGSKGGCDWTPAPDSGNIQMKDQGRPASPLGSPHEFLRRVVGGSCRDVESVAMDSTDGSFFFSFISRPSG